MPMLNIVFVLALNLNEVIIALHQWQICSFWHLFICNCRKNPLFGIWM